MASTETRWAELMVETRAAQRLTEVAAVLTWDQQTYLPPDGGAVRAEQLAAVSALQHARFASPRVGELLDDLAGRPDLDPDRAAGLANLRRDWHRAVAVPAELVERTARLTGLAQQAWLEARQLRSFDRFAPLLAEVVDATRERAAAIDASRPPYDVLLEEFEPGATAAGVSATFARLRAGLEQLLDAIRGVAPMPPLTGSWSVEQQRPLSDDLADALGYDRRAGRIDLAVHPFTTSLGRRDVRITTRVDPNDLSMMLGGTIHELGHALYEQGLPDADGSGLASAASMGLHESQSRFWENTIGRSLPFCRWFEGPLKRRLGAGAPDAETLYRASNRVVAGSNRVMADEVTYNLHVIVRFELEQALIAGELAVRDLREAWNAAYRAALGVDPVDDVDGVLQDIHWSGGAFGYFPTYTLGNLYAAALGRAVATDLPDLWPLVERGEFAPILGWLRERVHHVGRRHTSAEIVRRATNTGASDVDPTDLAVDALLDYLWQRHGALHGVSR
ncbi:MAG: carboxypeptidase M32 [Myxococcota bacterium]